MESAIAIVGVGCQYPDARTPEELWENVLAQRRAFRSIPEGRLRLEDYFSSDRHSPDRTYATQAALIEGYQFDRVRFCVAADTFRSADMAHWLALDVAARALSDAGFENGAGLPRETTGVFLGNTLTGEFSRANLMRLRWPYVRRVVQAALVEEGWPLQRWSPFLKKLETLYKQPFPAVGEESLAGGLSNTIAGRVCNHFNLKGGGYTVDGACASSLLAVGSACSALTAGDVDAALAGGVDLSLDPFELIGFAKVGALASNQMRIYDKQSDGFLPGEGCGLLLLMRQEDALARGCEIRALIKGWGIATDGSGGITRPEVAGQLLALQRAYRRAGFGIDSVAYFEGHGTGTSVGDTVELKALSCARSAARAECSSAVISSIKANVGHTKAAAGVAGLIKASFAVQTGILPPTAGCEDPHPEIARPSSSIKVLKTAEAWPRNLTRRAGVSSMGFGGIDAHVVLEAAEGQESPPITPAQRLLISSAQDAELLLLSANNADELASQVRHLLSFAAKLSQAEMTDLAGELQRTLGPHKIRAAIVASTPAGLADSLEELEKAISRGVATTIDISRGVFLGAGLTEPRIGFLFPGQGSPSHVDGGAFRRRFDFVDELYGRSCLVGADEEIATAIAQPAIVTASMAALQLLTKLNVEAEISVGHSLGELTAFHWAGALDELLLLRIAGVRGEAMQATHPNGAMASIGAGPQEVADLITHNVTIAGLNSPKQTVISGEHDAVGAVVDRARVQNLSAIILPVSHAFHSPLIAGAAEVVSQCLSRARLMPLQRTVYSTVTGEKLSSDANLANLICTQITAPVLFHKAATFASQQGIDLWLEVGPGQVLAGLMRDITQIPVISLDAGGSSISGLLHAVGAAFVLGRDLCLDLLKKRFTRPFNLDWQPKFFVNPCELAPTVENCGSAYDPREKVEVAVTDAAHTSAIDVLLQLVAQRTELPMPAIGHDRRLLSDLHLNSITVSQILVEAAARLGRKPPVAVTDFADGTISQIARALEEQAPNGHRSQHAEIASLPSGIDSWIRPFVFKLSERPPLLKSASVKVGIWNIFGEAGSRVNDLRACLERRVGDGVLVLLESQSEERTRELLLKAARAVLSRQDHPKFVLIQNGRHSSAAFARTLHLEAPHIDTCVLNFPEAASLNLQMVVDEVSVAQGFVETFFDNQGRRFQNVLKLLQTDDGNGPLPLSSDDVLLVTGGGKGITAECAIALAKETGSRLALVGRAKPESDPALATNLERLTAAKIEFRYFSADVNGAAAVRELVGKVESELGPITGLLHGAARNEPQLLTSLTAEAFEQTVSVKVQGLRQLLAAIEPEQLRLLIGFGSVIARTGLPGEADYAVANEWLTGLIEDWRKAHTSCRCFAIEWSLWSEIGMGTRLCAADRLLDSGVTPIPPEQGVAALLRLLRQPLDLVPVVVMSRYSDLPTFSIERPELPFLRFIQRTKVYYPQVELIVDVDLSPSTDPYLDDHQIEGRKLLPAVMGLEAMAQVAVALVGDAQPFTFKGIEFNHPVVIQDGETLPIRLAALVRKPGVVDIALRTAETGFQVDHFRATCQFGEPVEDVPTPGVDSLKYGTPIALDPARDLYGNIMFQRGRFRRLDNYRYLSAVECFAEIAPDGATSWFIHHLPGNLLLGDPGARDAAIHAIQACIPHQTVLPTAVDSIQLDPGRENTVNAPLLISARERSSDGRTFIYDLDVFERDGLRRERWRGLKLQAFGQPIKTPQLEVLLGPYLERRVRDAIPGTDLSVVLQRDQSPDRHVRSERAIELALGKPSPVIRRPDGKPMCEERSVSVAHEGDLTIAVAGSRPVGCDLARVEDRPPCVWRALLGDRRIELAQLIARRASESGVISATRVWAAGESLKKVGAIITAPLILVSAMEDGCVLLASGDFRIVTCVAELNDRKGRFVMAVLS